MGFGHRQVSKPPGRFLVADAASFCALAGPQRAISRPCRLCRSSLNDLISLGSFFQTISAFFTSQWTVASPSSVTRQALGSGLSGGYRACPCAWPCCSLACCTSALDVVLLLIAEVLQLYREAILEVQQRCKLAETLQVAALQIYLERFKASPHQHATV